LKKQLHQNKDTQVSTTDPQSRAVVHTTRVVEVSYNTQVATDEKHPLVVHYEVTNENDRKALHPTTTAAKENVGLSREDSLRVLADRGYFNSEQLDACKREGMMTYVPQPGNQQHSGVPAKGYRGEDFSYHKTSDSYTCPQGHILTTNGQWYIKKYMSRDHSGNEKSAYLMKHYKTEKCLQCPVLHLCTTNKKGRLIERSQYAEAVEQNNKRVRLHKDIYLRRQQIVEHPFGTIKRGWGYSYTLLKGLKKVSADLGLVYLCYNLKRVMNILTPQKMLQKVQLAA
jgi:hypothetical protein